MVLIIPIYGLLIAITYLTYWIVLVHKKLVEQVVPLETKSAQPSAYQHLIEQEVKAKVAALKRLLEVDKVCLEEKGSYAS